MDTKEARQSKQYLQINSSDVEVLFRQGRKLAKVILQSHEPSLEEVVQEIVHRAEKKPTDIDSLIRIYFALTEELGSKVNWPHVNGTAVETQSGKRTAIRLLNTKLHERYIALTEAVRTLPPWDGADQTPGALDSRKVMAHVVTYGETRRSIIILQALRGRFMALGLQSLDDLPGDPTVPSLHRLVSSAQGEVTDDTEFIGEIVLVLAAGHFLAPPRSNADDQITYLEQTRRLLEERLRLPSSFREKYLTAHAVKSLNNGGKPWPSANLFGETNWIG